MDYREELFKALTTGIDGVFRIKSIDALVEVCNAARKEGYSAGLKDGNISDGTLEEKVKEAYENGANDAWSLAYKLEESPFDFYDGIERKDIWGYMDVEDIIKQLTGAQALANVKEYEKKQKQSDGEITVGDEIYSLDKNYKSVVTAIFDTCRGVTAVYFTQNGKMAGDLLKNLHKTGRHFPQIAEVLEQMQEGEE